MPYTFSNGQWNSNIGLHGGIVDDLSGLAADAIADKITGLDMLQASDSRVPATLDVEGDWIGPMVKGPNDEILLGTRGDGTLVVPPGITVGDGAVMTTVDAEDVFWAAGGFSDPTTGEIRFSELQVDKNGELPAWAAKRIVERGGGGGGSIGTGTVHVLIGMGQSNMSGRAEPISAEIDPPDPRIFQYGANATEITEATVPLDMVDAASGISPLTLIAREYVKRLPPGDVILLIPAAKGSSALGTSTGDYPNGVWNVAYSGASVDLYGLAKTQIDAAFDAIGEKWPNAAVNLVGMFWNQGESNATTTQSNYATRFDDILADLRTHLADPDMPVVLGGMVPEWVDSTPGAENVRAAHIDTPKRIPRTAYAYPPPNSGGNANLNPINQIHFHREGIEELSRRMLKAWDRALRNATTTVPNAPQTVSATVNNTTLTVTWSQPMCRYTAFTPEFSYDGSTWTPITHTTVDTTAVATITQAPVLVRVSTTSEYGTSVPSTPVYATIVKEPA